MKRLRVLSAAVWLVALAVGIFGLVSLFNTHFLPLRYFALTVVGFVVLMFASFLLIAKSKMIGQSLGFILATAILIASSLGLKYLNRSLAFVKQISVAEPASTTPTASSTKPFDITTDAFNIFIGGVDASDKLNDVNMIVTVNPKTRKILLTGIPRDYYVPFHNTGIPDKLTHSGAFMGADITNTMLTVADFMELPLQYYVRVDFSAIKTLVDLIGGVDFYSDYAFRSTTMPKCAFSAGQNHANGYCALAFSRERKFYGTGDLHRVENQSVIIEAIMKKLSNHEFLLSHYEPLLDATAKVLRTNLPENYLSAFLQFELDQNPQWEIAKKRLNGTHAFNVPSHTLNGMPLTMIIPDQASIDAAKLRIKTLMTE